MKYDATYKIGKTTINVVAPPPRTVEETIRILDAFYAAIGAIVDGIHDKQDNCH